MPARGDEPAAWRNALVDMLVNEGHVKSALVKRAMRDVPRHAFVPEAPAERAYENRGIPVSTPAGEPVSSLSAPGWVAAMLEELALAPGMSVLEVGAGTGYHAALVSSIVGRGGRVVTIEIEPWLAQRARERLAKLGYGHVSVIEGDGATALPDETPFDRVLLTTGTWEVFPAWIRQLKQGGRFVAPLQFEEADARACVVVNLERQGDHLLGRAVMDSEMVPMRGEAGGLRSAETSRAGAAWRPSAIADLRSVRVYPRSVQVDPRSNEKLFVRRECKILLERSPG